MKDKYHVANFATFVSKTLISPPPQKKKKMDEFNFKLAQYCINKNNWTDQNSCIWVISEWV